MTFLTCSTKPTLINKVLGTVLYLDHIVGRPDLKSSIRFPFIEKAIKEHVSINIIPCTFDILTLIGNKNFI